MFLRETKREIFNMVKMERQPLKEEPEKDNLATHDSYYFLIKSKCHTKNCIIMESLLYPPTFSIDTKTFLWLIKHF